jgi:hypothetical protein
MLIKQSTAVSPLMFLMVDSSDHITGKTGLTPTVTISKNGGAFATPTGAVTELSGGWYKIAANATDSDTLGQIVIHATSAGADPCDDKSYEVVLLDPQTAVPTAAANAAGLLDLAAGVETGLTFRQALRGIVATLFGKVSGAATTTISIRDQADTKDRIVATVDANGNRSAITKDFT